MNKPTLLLSDSRLVLKSDYIRAKTGDLQNYGYESLTEEDLAEQVEKILAGEELNIIGMFCQDDINVDGTNKNNHE